MSLMTVLVPRFATLALRSTCRVLFQKNVGAVAVAAAAARPSKAGGHKYQTSHTRNFLATQHNLKKDTITVYFVDRDGDQIATSAELGDSLLDVAINNSVELEGACEGTMACSTCHLILPKDAYDKLPCPPSDEEQDILDMAYGLTDTSRLGCQVYITEDMDGLEVRIPVETSDLRNVS